MRNEVGREKEEKRGSPNTPKRIFSAFLGVLSGIVNVLLGGGGGMLTVPALSLIGDPEKKAHATAIAVMLPLSIISAILYSARGVWDASLGLIVAAGASLGGVVGAFLLKKVPKGLLSLFFYAVMIYAGIRFLL